MKTRQLQTLWWDWLSTSERLLRFLHEQTAALVLRDVLRVEKLQVDLDALISKLGEIDREAVTCLRELAGELGTEFHLRGLMQVLEKAEAQQLHGLANRVKVAARNVQNVLAKNRALLESEMTYINGTLTLLARAVSDSQGIYRSSSHAVVSSAITVDTAA